MKKDALRFEVPSHPAHWEFHDDALIEIDLFTYLLTFLPAIIKV